MSVIDTHPESPDDDDSQTLRSRRLWEAAGKQELDFDSQRLRNRLRAKMFGVDASPVKIGRFVVLETVGSGGMGVVYAAYDEELDRRVAVKLLRPSRDDDASVGKSRLVREAQALAKLSHPNVVQVYDVGTFDDRVFLAMEYLEGPDLRTWLLDGPRPWKDVLSLFLDAGKGLAAAHREGIIHRDFKPANVLFGRDGRARVVDFGLARAFEPARAPQPVPSGGAREPAFEVELTQTGEIMGTPAYMSPEQARHEGVDARSDQYSFCVALYEALFGRRPHVGHSTTELLVAVAEGKVAPPPRNPKVPARIVRAVMRGLSADPGDRFPSMEALLARLSLEERGRWRLLGGGALAVAGLSAFIFTTPAECPSFESALADAWGPDQAAAIEAAFALSGTPRSEVIAARVNERLDAYAREWQGARLDACEAHLVRREQSAPLHDQRVACLLERQVELATLATVLADADPSMIDQAPRAAAELSPIAECQDFDRMSTEAALDPARQERRQQLRVDLAEIRAQYKAGLYARALHGVETVAEAARAEGAHGLEAAARLQEGLIQERRRAFGPAAEAVEQALDLAEVAHDDALAAQAWSRLARYQARLGELGLADASVRRAWAKVHRLDDDPELQLEVRESQALAAWMAERLDEAIEQQQAVVEQHRARRGADDPLTADAERRLANILSDRGLHDEAQARYARVREVLARAYGPDHPMVAHVVVDAAIDHRAAGRLDRARSSFLEAERLFVENLGPDAPALLTVHKALADLALEADDLDALKLRVERLSVLSRSSDASPTDRPDALALAGVVAGRLGEHQQAVDAYHEFLQLTEGEPLLHAYRLDRVGARTNLAQELLALQRVDEAEHQARRALDELDPITIDESTRALAADHRANIWLTLGKIAEARDESAVEAYEQGLRSWPADAPVDAAGRGTRAELEWALAHQLEVAEPDRARRLAQSARVHIDPALGAEIDAWLEARAPTHGA